MANDHWIPVLPNVIYRAKRGRRMFVHPITRGNLQIIRRRNFWRGRGFAVFVE